MTIQNPELLEKWLEALESGEYTQGMGALKRTTYGRDEFCCLGVLCDIAGASWSHAEGVSKNSASMNGKYFVNYVPAELIESVGIDHERQGDIAKRNDAGMSFKYIANYIRQLIK